MSLEKFFDQTDDGVDPRVQVELERLNTATDEINKLEVDVDEARNQFRLLLQESISRIDNCAKKLGSCIIKVKPYYDARIKAKEALQETQKAAVNFERANSAHAAAKEMVFLAEEGLKAEGRTFDHAWQEMLNHATMRVNDSEAERTLAEAEHKRTSQNYQVAELRVRSLQKELKRAITKSRPYYELKIHYTLLLEKQKLKVKNLEKQVAEVKLSYAQTLKNLERISDEIHKTRQKNKHSPIPELGMRSEYAVSEFDLPNRFASMYNLPNSNLDCASDLQKDDKTDVQPRIIGDGDDSRIGNDPPGVQTCKILSPTSASTHSNQTLTPNTTVSSQPDTDIWSECAGVNSEASPISENNSSLTGPPDIESEDEILKTSQNSMNIERLKSKASAFDLKSSGDIEFKNNIRENLSFLCFEKNSNPSNRGSYFEGVGICSFPVQTELNVNFNNGQKIEGNAETENDSGWTEIKLTSPEEKLFSTVKVNSVRSRNELEEDFEIPYAPLPEECDSNNVNYGNYSAIERNLDRIEVIDDDLEKNGLEDVCGLRPGKKEVCESEEFGSRSLKGTPRKINLRRQSLDVLWNNTAGEKVKEILSQSIMKLNISSLTERKSTDSRMSDGNDAGEAENFMDNAKANDSTYESTITNQFGINFFNRKNSKAEEDIMQTMEEKKSGNHQESISIQLGGFIPRKERFSFKKVPRPLEKTLNYLNPDEESNSDSESLASSDMLTDEQLASLVLDRDLAEIYQDIIS